MTTGIVHDQNMEKQQMDKNMRGCMAGFFNIFDRNNVLSGKRLYPKRLPPSIVIESPSGSASSVGSPAVSREFERPKPQELAKSTASSDCLTTPASATPPPDALTKSPATVSPWKFAREAPRLSLDSRLHPRGIRTTSSAAAGEARRDDESESESERQRRSPSVVARLMGLERLPSSESSGGDLPEKKVELRRSASESRSRDLLHCRFTDGNMFPANLQYQSTSGFATTNTREYSNGGRDSSNGNIDGFGGNAGRINERVYTSWSANPEPALKPRMRKVLYDFADFFPEPKPAVTSIYDDIEKRLKVRGIDEPSKDLETLKQILEALQLKGLLHHHSKPPTVPASQIGRRNFVYEQRFPYEDSPIVVMKPARSPRTSPRRNLPLSSSMSPRRERPEMARTARSPMRNPTPTSPGRSENRSTSPAATRRKAAASVESQRKVKETITMVESRRVSPVGSPRIVNRRTDQTASSQSPRRRRSTGDIRRAEDESSTISESSFSTSSHTDTERSKMEESYKDGKNLLERCDKLLHSIAEMTSATSNNCTELQPSPVSVLDSSFYKEEESSPSPVMKRTIDFKDLEDEIWSPSSSAEGFMLKSSDTEDNADDQQDHDFTYVSEIIRASNYLPDDSDIFLLLEKQQSVKGRDTSNSSRLQRRLIFDTIIEILDRNRQLPPWKLASSGPSSREVWSELQRIQKKGDESEDMFEVICGVMKRDLTRDSINGWGGCQFEISEAVLDIERLIFKDLIGETIRDHAIASAPRRKLVF